MNDARLPPHDTDAEEAVIGSLLIDGTAIFKIAVPAMIDESVKAENVSNT